MLYIRVDMNDIIATGHMMRCIAIAEAAKKCGENTTFLLADTQAVPLLEKQGFRYLVLDTRWDDMDAELAAIRKVVEENKIDKILIDSYQVTRNYLEKMSGMTKTIYLDDLNAFYYPVDALICYANYWEDFHYIDKYKNTRLFLGPGYAPIRKQFSECGKKHIKPQAENLILLSGGTDHFDILNKVLEKLKKSEYRSIDVICGMYYQNYDLLQEKYSSYRNVHIYKAVPDIENYMKHADLAITAGGTTLYELCALGLPAISYSLADNQIKNVKKFQEEHIIAYAGDARSDDVAGNIACYLNQYHKNAKLRQEISEKMQRLIDGKGAERIVKAIWAL